MQSPFAANRRTQNHTQTHRLIAEEQKKNNSRKSIEHTSVNAQAEVEGYCFQCNQFLELDYSFECVVICIYVLYIQYNATA